jgi:hypothetical protein
MTPRNISAPKRNGGQTSGQGIVRDDRGQEAPADKSRARQSSSRRQHGESDPPLRGDRDEPSSRKK